jgi:hypothetical protein
MSIDQFRSRYLSWFQQMEITLTSVFLHLVEFSLTYAVSWLVRTTVIMTEFSLFRGKWLTHMLREIGPDSALRAHRQTNPPTLSPQPDPPDPRIPLATNSPVRDNFAKFASMIEHSWEMIELTGSEGGLGWPENAKKLMPGNRGSQKTMNIYHFLTEQSLQLRN